MNKKITFVCGEEEWDGMFVDGNLVLEGHTLDWQRVLSALKIDYEVKEAPQEWLNDIGGYPTKLGDCQFTT